MLDVRSALNVSGVVEGITDGNVGAVAVLDLSVKLGEPRGGTRNVHKQVGRDRKVE